MLKIAIPTPFAHQVRTAREMVNERRRVPEETRVPTASEGFDRLLEGGLGRGSMVELIGRRSSGRFSLVLSTLAAATSAGETAALVDLGDALDPQAATEAGVDLERLLWARPRHIKDALASAEVILASGMPVLVIDLGMPPIAGGRGAEASWLRLARSARAHGAALLVSSPYRASGTAAQAVLETQRPRAAWSGHSSSSHGSSPQLLRGIATEIEIVKSRKAQSQGKTESLTWQVAEFIEHETSAPWPQRRRHETRRSGPMPIRERAIA